MLLLAVMPAMAQAGPGIDLSLEASSDQRRRGLSWSDGRPTIEAGVSVPLAGAFDLGLAASPLRGSARHGGADGVADLSLRYRQDLGLLSLSGGATGHVFAGASELSYAELDARLGFSLGPARLSAGAAYAPPQSAIGGDNLYLHAGVDIGVPGTPLSLYGHVGRSSGRVDDPVRATRLRPENQYRDHAVGMDYAMGPLTAGLRYTDTSITRTDPAAPFMDRHVGARLTGSLRFAF
jgi:uncharacterized protein (TIGR02001 family)